MKNRIPSAVSIVAKLKAIPTNRILVQNRPENRKGEKKTLAICVKPIHYNYNKAGTYLEKLFYLLGAPR